MGTADAIDAPARVSNHGPTGGRVRPLISEASLFVRRCAALWSMATHRRVARAAVVRITRDLVRALALASAISANIWSTV